MEFWEPKIFKIIGDSLDTFLKVALETKLKTTTFVATIYVELDMGQGLPNVTMRETGDHYFMQTLNYKNVPFKCSHHNSHGRLKISCPLYKKSDEMGGTHLVITLSNFREDSNKNTKNEKGSGGKG